MKSLGSKCFIEKECPVCGRTFVPAPFHVYVEDNKFFCKWTCLTKYRRDREAVKKKKALTRYYTVEEKRKALRMILVEDKLQKDVSEELKIPTTTIGRWLGEYKAGEMEI